LNIETQTHTKKEGEEQKSEITRKGLQTRLVSLVIVDHGNEWTDTTGGRDWDCQSERRMGM
jgi:hypothetical protein